MPCPTSATVHDGIYGTAAKPARRGQPIVFTATLGLFGTATTVKGKGVLRSGGNSVSLSDTDLNWFPTQVTIKALPSLPISANPATWQVELIPDGETTPCGPYSIVVEAATPALTCPTSAQVVNGTTPATRQRPVVVAAVAGLFGDLVTTSGNVDLKRGMATTVTVPKEDITWTPAAVTFLLPDVPDSITPGQPETWQIFLTPMGATTACGPYQLLVDFLKPILIFVDPLAISERNLNLVATGLGGNTEVRMYDRQDRYLLTVFPPPTRIVVGLRMQVPTVRELIEALDKVGAYARNQLRADVQIAIRDKSTQYETVKLPTTVVMPPPAIGTLIRKGRQAIQIGDPTGPRLPDLGEISSNEWLGPPTRGTVVLYRDEPPDRELQNVLARLATDLTTRALPTAQTESALQALKSKGDACSWTAWTEEKIEAFLYQRAPSDIVLEGSIIVWRDDLPSPARPVPIELCMKELLEPLVQELFRVNAPPAPVAPGAPVALTVVSTGATNLLSRLRQSNALIGIDFTFSLLRNDAAPVSGSLVTLPGNQFSPAGSLSPGSALTLLLRPPLELQTALSPTASDKWTLTVKAMVKNLPGCAGPVEVTLPAVSFLQMALPVPEMVLAFRGLNFGPGDWQAQGTYVFLSPFSSSFLPPPITSGIVIDRGQGTGTIEAAKTIVDMLLTSLIGRVTPLAAVFGSEAAPPIGQSVIPTSAFVGVLSMVLDRLRTSAANEVIVDSRTMETDLGARNPGWNDLISSLAMIGPPAGRTLTLFENSGQTGRSVPLRLPPTSIIGTFTTIHQSWDTNTVRPGPATPPTGLGLLGEITGFGNIATSTLWA